MIFSLQKEVNFLQRHWKKWILFFGFLLIIFTLYTIFLPKLMDIQETIILGQQKFIPNSQASLRVITRDRINNIPIALAQVKIELKSKKEKIVLFEGKTDQRGSVEALFTVPKIEGEQELIVRTSSPKGRDEIKEKIKIERDFKILLSTDKPIYQPGQAIHIRALLLESPQLKAAEKVKTEVTVEDPKGNKVFKKDLETNEYGVLSCDFLLGHEINLGFYKIRATAGKTISERTVNIKKYVLPKFQVKLSTDKTYYLPGQNLLGKIQADYFFGKPVADSLVEIIVSTFEVELQEFARIEGKTNKEGFFSFDLKLPDYFVGLPLEKGKGNIIFEVTVIDRTNHSEKTTKSIPVAESSIIVELLPEAGEFVPGIENLVNVITSYPDGNPAICDLKIRGSYSGEIKTNKYGLSQFNFNPSLSNLFRFDISVIDRFGNKTQVLKTFQADYKKEYILIRPEKSVYQIGETLHLNVFSTGPTKFVYFDIVKNKQTILTKTLELKDGQASLEIDLSQDFLGTLELHAYKVLTDMEISRNTRLITVIASRDLVLKTTSDKDIYFPGSQARIDLEVKKNGLPLEAAVGVNIVDESVFALAEEGAGLEKIYFLLEKEILEPKFDIHGFTLPEIITDIIEIEPPEIKEKLELIRQQSAQILLTKVSLGPSFNLSSNSYSENLAKVQRKQLKYYSWLKNILFLFTILITLPIVFIIFRRLKKEKWLLKRILWLIGAFLGFIFLILLLIIILSFSDYWLHENPTLLERLESGLEVLSSILPSMLPSILLFVAIFLLIFGLISLIALIIYAIKKDDRILKNLLLLIFFWTLSVIGFCIISIFLDLIENKRLLLIIGSFLLIFLCLLTESIFLAFQKRKIAIAAFGFSLLFFLLPMLVIIVPMLLDRASRPLERGMLEDTEEIMTLREMAGAAPPSFPSLMSLLPIKEEIHIPKIELDEKRLIKPAETAEAPRLRQFFPETLYWNPLIITNKDGRANFEFPIADNITTWRATFLASSLNGEIGTAQLPLVVFQDFFVDLDLPIALTQDDEISIPVGIYNYLPQGQSIRIKIKKEDWFDLFDKEEKTIFVGANDISVIYFTIKAKLIGDYSLTVEAFGDKLSDALKRQLTIIPNGKKIEKSISERLIGESTKTFNIPPEAINGASKLILKIYPGIFSQVVEGLDEILRMPSGCFEQTSSVTYPNILVLDYMRSTQQVTPEIEMKAEQYINVGYQRLLTFEVPGGGFSLYGKPPANLMLTAYGLFEFSDMAKVYSVDEKLIKRTIQWLISKQNPDGSWSDDRGFFHERRKEMEKNLSSTAYVTWALLEAGKRGKEIDKAINYLRTNLSQSTDPYTLALLANIFVAYDKADLTTQNILEQLLVLKTEEGNDIFWQNQEPALMGGYGKTGNIETTALVVQALIKAQRGAHITNRALDWLIKQKDSRGTWYSTQATIASMKALIALIEGSREKSEGKIEVILNQKRLKEIIITPETSDILQIFDLSENLFEGENIVNLRFEGEGNLYYQLAARYYLPWDLVFIPEKRPPLEIKVNYERTTLKVNDIVNVKVSLENKTEAIANLVIIDLGVPTGFEALTEDLEQILIEKKEDIQGKIERYELAGRQLIIYLDKLDPYQILTFSFRIKAKFPIKAKTLPSTTYEYYNPENQDILAPIEIKVN